MAPALRQFIQEEYAVVGQGHFARQGHLAAADEVHVGDRVVLGAEGVRDHQGRALDGEAGDAVDMHASCGNQSAASCPGRLHPRGQRR